MCISKIKIGQMEKFAFTREWEVAKESTSEGDSKLDGQIGGWAKLSWKFIPESWCSMC